MAVMLETSKGELVIDLYTDDCPVACKNFLKLCKMKYYNNCLFHNVQRHFIAQTGDPTATGKGGESIYGILYGEQARFFEDEIHSHRRHTKMGLVGMASAGKDLNASQFYITLGTDLTSLDGRFTVFGEVAEGLELLEQLNEVLVDDDGRPLQNIRIRHTTVLDDPYDDPPQLEEHIPEASPEPQFEQGGRLEEDWVPDDQERPAEEVERATREHEAKSRAVVLEMIGDLPEAEVKPPSNMLFVCKLNPVTTEEDLEIIFSRYGKVTSCDIIRDYKTGDSLCYAFIAFDSDEACEAAYFKMNNVLIDDRRIKVDFSQSVHHIWKQFKTHGKGAGNAQMGKDAQQHERQQRGGAMELKQQYQQQRFGGRGGQQGLLFDNPGQQPGEIERGRGTLTGGPVQPEPRRRSRSRDRSKRHRSSSRERSKWHRSSSRERSNRRGSSRSRSRERSKHSKHTRDGPHHRDLGGHPMDGGYQREKDDRQQARRHAGEHHHSRQRAQDGREDRHHHQQQYSSGQYDDRDKHRSHADDRDGRSSKSREVDGRGSHRSDREGGKDSKQPERSRELHERDRGHHSRHSSDR